MTDLISHIAHPPEVLDHANAQHAQLPTRIRARDADGAVRIMAEHLRGTELVLAACSRARDCRRRGSHRRIQPSRAWRRTRPGRPASSRAAA